MNRNVIAKAYWRAIKRGSLGMASLPEEIRPYVLLLAQSELEQGRITQEEYDSWTGGEVSSR